MKIKNLLNFKILIVIVITVILPIRLLILPFFKPISETMSCDSNYICSVKRQFILDIKKEQTIVLDINSSRATYLLEHSKGYRSDSYADLFYLTITDKDGKLIKPFSEATDAVTFNYALMTNREYSQNVNYAMEQRIKIEDALYKNFEDYLKNPNKEFQISSVASLSNNIELPLIIFIPIGIIVLWILRPLPKKQEDNQCLQNNSPKH